jgi:hypothetical protein
LNLGAGVILKGLVASADFNGDHIPDLVESRRILPILPAFLGA